MISAGIYLLKASFFVLAFYLPFALILKRTTFFNINRVYLVLGLLLSFALPLYKGFAENTSYAAPDLVFVEPIFAQTELVILKANESPNFLEVGFLLSTLYFIGIAFRLIIVSRSIAGIYKIKERSEPLVYRNLHVFRMNSYGPFTFFNNVFLTEAYEDRGILEHEAAHVRQYHWIDLLITEVASIVLWFNPLMILYKLSLKQQHEYLADQATIRGGITIEEYLLAIKRQMEFVTLSPLTSEFYFSSIKNRINMLTKKRTTVLALSTYVMVLPFVVFLLMAFSSRKDFNIIEPINSTLNLQEEMSFITPIVNKSDFQFESGYGERVHPTLHVLKLHTGVDLSAKEGIPVISSEEGEVIKAMLDGPWGNIITIQHNNTYSTSYAHLKSMNVKRGDKVRKGQEIGLVGNTGISTKSHLHFELHKDGIAIDPPSYLQGLK